MIPVIDTLNSMGDYPIAKASDIEVNQNTRLDNALSGKVDKVSGKGLSTNDYTTSEKAKLAGVAEGATNVTVDSALSTTSTNAVQNKAVATAINSKAEKSYVDTEIAKKVDKETGKGLSTNDYTTAEKTKLAGVATGATKVTVDDTLSTTSSNAIANGTVTTALSSKVDKVNGKGLSTNDYTSAEKTKLSGVETGATKTIVDDTLTTSSTNPVQNKVVTTALNAKADSSTVSALTTAVNGKADSSTVSAIDSRVSANETNIATQTSRIDNIASLPSGSTSGDAELTDIRVGADNVTYDSAGSAVRTQITNVTNDLNYVYKRGDYRFAVGNAGVDYFIMERTGTGSSSKIKVKLKQTSGSDANSFWIYYGNVQQKVSYARTPFTLENGYYVLTLNNNSSLKYDIGSDTFYIRDQWGSTDNNDRVTLLANNIGILYGLMANQFITPKIYGFDDVDNRFFASNASDLKWLYNYNDTSNLHINILIPKTSGSDANSFWIYKGEKQIKVDYSSWSFLKSFNKYYKLELRSGRSIRYNLDTGAAEIVMNHDSSNNNTYLTLLNNNSGELVGMLKHFMLEATPTSKHFGLNGATLMSGAEPPKNFNYSKATKIGMVIEPTGGSDFMGGMVESPSIIFDESINKYVMVYTAYTTGSVGSIGYAESSDLVTWTGHKKLFEASGVAANGDQYGCTGPCLYKYNGIYYLFYLGLNGSGYEGEPITMCLATTTSLANPDWTYKGSIIPLQTDINWCKLAIYHPCVTNINGKWVIFFNARGEIDGVTAERTGFAVSDRIDGNYIVDTNRISKFAEGRNPNSFIQCGDPSIVEIDNLMYMFYFTSDNTTATDHYAYTTKDLFPFGWKYWSQSTNTDATYDSKYAHKPFVIRKTNKLYYFYTAVDTSRRRSIALQTFDI